MTFNIISDGDPVLAAPIMQNYRHINYGSALLPVDTNGSSVDDTIDIGSSTRGFKDLFLTGTIYTQKSVKYEYSISATSSGVVIKTIDIGLNTGVEIDVYGAGLVDGTDFAISSIKFSIYKKLAGTIIVRRDDTEFADGENLGMRFEVETNGSVCDLKAYTDSGTWAVSGIMEIRGSGSITLT